MSPIRGSLGEVVAARRKWERGLDWWMDELRAEHLNDLRQALAKFIERERNPLRMRTTRPEPHGISDP